MSWNYNIGWVCKFVSGMIYFSVGNVNSSRFFGAALNSIGAPILTTRFECFSANFEILYRLNAFLYRFFPTGLGTQTVFLRGRYPSDFSIIDRTSILSHAIITSSGVDISRIRGANSLAWAGWSITQPIAIIVAHKYGLF